MLSYIIHTVKRHYSLIPLLVSVGGATCGAVFYLGRIALREPEVSWHKKKNPEPWQEYKDKQYKFYSPNMDYSKVKSQAPEY